MTDTLIYLACSAAGLWLILIIRRAAQPLGVERHDQPVQKPEPTPAPALPVVGRDRGQLLSGGMPAYRCALRIVYDMCQTLTAQVSQLQQATNGGPSMLPGSIPATGVIHVPSSAIDRLSGEES